MDPIDLEARVAALEADVTRLKGRIEKPVEPAISNLEKYAGSWADDPIYDEAMRLGREYRESLRPKAPQRRKT